MCFGRLHQCWFKLLLRYETVCPQWRVYILTLFWYSGGGEKCEQLIWSSHYMFLIFRTLKPMKIFLVQCVPEKSVSCLLIYEEHFPPLTPPNKNPPYRILTQIGLRCSVNFNKAILCYNWNIENSWLKYVDLMILFEGSDLSEAFNLIHCSCPTSLLNVRTA